MPTPASKSARDRNALVRVIGVYHLAKGVLVAGAGFGVLRLLSPGATQDFADWLGDLPFAAESAFMQRVIVLVADLTRIHVQELAVAILLYAALFLTEGVGLCLGMIWAEYLTIVATGSLIPFEVYEVTRKLTATRTIVLTANVLLVIYLIAHRLQAARARRSTRG
jgi:uncharacterized membrane protein (DUF2068 family)